MIEPRTYTDEMERLEELKNDALSRQDSALYAVLCEESGEIPDENEMTRNLYEQGKARLETDYIDTSQPGNEISRLKLLSLIEIANLPETDIRRFRPHLLKSPR